MKKSVIISFLLVLFTLPFLKAQTTAIPDTAFEQALIDLGYDDILDDYVVTDSINDITSLNIFNKNIKDLTGIEDFTALEILNCSNNGLSSLDLSYNPELVELNCSSNIIGQANLKVSNNGKLEQLYCSDNLIQNLNLSKNLLLEVLDFTSNQIVTLNLVNNDSLSSIKASNNRLNSFNIENLKKLEVLECSNNQLTALNISENKYVKNLLISSNQITKIDLRGKDSLVFLDVSNNQISSLDLNTSRLLTNLTASANNISELNLSKLDSLSLLGISDNQLKALDILNNLKLKNIYAANNQINTMDYSNNLYLKEIDVSRNLISTANLEANDSITSIDFSFNQLANINVSKNTKIKRLNVSNNQITSINLSTNDSITSVICSYNNLTELQLNNGNNEVLETLVTNNNDNLFCIQIDDINQIGDFWLKDDHTNYYDDPFNSGDACDPLTYVPDDNFENELIVLGLDTELDNYIVTSNINGLTEIDLDSLGIIDLTGLQDFVSLKKLNCSNNLIVSLEVSDLTNLADLNCSSNFITGLYIKYNDLEKLDATGNTGLTCIVVNDVGAAENNANWTVDDPNLYKLECSADKTYVPDDQFEQALIDLRLDIGPLDDYVPTAAVQNVKLLDIQKKNIFDLTGIEAFESLQSLNCAENNLDELDISRNLQLLRLVCFNNNLSKLDVSKNKFLLELNVGNNEIDSLDVAMNTNLIELICDKNNLTWLNLKSNAQLKILNINANHIFNTDLVENNLRLTHFYCAANDFKQINISLNNLLIELDLSDNHFESINLADNTALEKLNTSLNLLTELNIENNTQLRKVNTNSNYLNYLEFSNHAQLDSLSCDHNQIQKSNDANIPDGLIISNAGGLRYLSASDNNMSEIKISKNVDLMSLDISGNRLTAIDVSKNDKLIQLYCDRNELDNLILMNNIDLELLKCSYNQINALDISKNLSIRELSASTNSLAALDLSLNSKLTSLAIENNQLISIELSKNILLQYLSLSGNSLETLDVSLNSKLVSFQASSNSLHSIYMKNGNNIDLETFAITDNPDLTCIEVDDAAFAEANEGWQKDEAAAYNENCRYSETYIPDDNFEQVLIDLKLDMGPLDDYVLTNNISSLNELILSNKEISDLTGIEDFINLTQIDVSNNKLDSLNLSYNTSLTSINCARNRLDNILLSEDIEVLEKLISMDISLNQFKDFHWSSFSDLHNLDISSNDFVDLDLSQNESLTSLNCSFNELVSLNLKNGFNDFLGSLDASSNKELVCIEVDDVNSNILNNWKKDNTASYSENCHYNEIYIPDDAFEQALIDAGYDYEGTDSLDDYVPNSQLIPATSLFLRGKGVVDLTGLEAFENLALLDIQSNEIEYLDLSGHLKLRKLYCSDNQLKSLDLSRNDLMEELNCASNMMNELDLSQNSLLKELNVNGNSISELDVKKNTNLKILNCSGTNISQLDLALNIQLEKLIAINNEALLVVDVQSGNNQVLESLNLLSNPSLNCILVDNKDEAYANANWIKEKRVGYKIICDDDDNDGIGNIEDICPTTPFGDFVDLFGCSIFSLPIDNFSVMVTDETCSSSNNGKVNIESNEVYNFIATISNDNYYQSVNFGATTEIRNLKAGSYDLCITIEGREKFEVCYEISIGEPQDLSVYSNISESAGTVLLKMTGADKYFIDHNGLVFNTTDRDVAIPLSQGINIIEISTNIFCQGVYKRTIFHANESVCYPNPFENYFTIYLGSTDLKKMNVQIFSSLGQLVLSKFISVQNGSVQIDGSTLASGVYSVFLTWNTEPKYFKIVKI